MAAVIIPILLFLLPLFSPSAAVLRRATCFLEGIGDTAGLVYGRISFTQDGANATLIHVSAQGLGSKRERGIHIRSFGDVSDTYHGLHTGGHFAAGTDSDLALHGKPGDTDPRPHNGDLGNIISDAFGNFSGHLADSPSAYITLNGSIESIIGRAFVIDHEADRFDRLGHLPQGKRYAQCVVGIANTGTDGIESARNEAAPTPLPTGSYASCKLQPLFDSHMISNPAVSGSVVNGTLQMWTDDNGRMNVDLRVTGLEAGAKYRFMPHKFGDISSVEMLGPVIHPDDVFHNFTTNCRGAYVDSTSVSARVFPLNQLVGRSLALYSTNTTTGAHNIVAACVIGQMNPRTLNTYSVLTPTNIPPRAHCQLTSTDIARSLGMSISGVVYINATDEFDCATSVYVSISGLNTTLGAKHGFHIHTYGDLLDPNGVRLGSHYNPDHKKHGDFNGDERHVGDFPNLEPVNGTVEGTVVKYNDRLSLNGLISALGRSVVVHQNADDGVTQPSGDSGSRLAMCAIGRSDYATEAETWLHAPNSLICQEDPSLSQGIAVFSATQAWPSVSGYVYFVQNTTTHKTFAYVTAIGAPLTAYQLRVYSHGAKNPDAANIAGSSNLLRVIAQPPSEEGGIEQSVFFSDSDGFLNIEIGPLCQTPDDVDASIVALGDWLGRIISVHPIINGQVYPATGYGVLGMTNSPPPDFTKGSVSSQSSARNEVSTSSSDEFFGSPLGVATLAAFVLVLGLSSFYFLKRRNQRSDESYIFHGDRSPTNHGIYGTFTGNQLPL